MTKFNSDISQYITRTADGTIEWTSPEAFRPPPGTAAANNFHVQTCRHLGDTLIALLNQIEADPKQYKRIKIKVAGTDKTSPEPIEDVEDFRPIGGPGWRKMTDPNLKEAIKNLNETTAKYAAQTAVPPIDNIDDYSGIPASTQRLWNLTAHIANFHASFPLEDGTYSFSTIGTKAITDVRHWPKGLEPVRPTVVPPKNEQTAVPPSSDQVQMHSSTKYVYSTMRGKGVFWYNSERGDICEGRAKPAGDDWVRLVPVPKTVQKLDGVRPTAVPPSSSSKVWKDVETATRVSEAVAAGREPKKSDSLPIGSHERAEALMEEQRAEQKAADHGQRPVGAYAHRAGPRADDPTFSPRIAFPFDQRAGESVRQEAQRQHAELMKKLDGLDKNSSVPFSWNQQKVVADFLLDNYFEIGQIIGARKAVMDHWAESMISDASATGLLRKEFFQ